MIPEVVDNEAGIYTVINDIPNIYSNVVCNIGLEAFVILLSFLRNYGVNIRPFKVVSGISGLMTTINGTKIHIEPIIVDWNDDFNDRIRDIKRSVPREKWHMVEAIISDFVSIVRSSYERHAPNIVPSMYQRLSFDRRNMTLFVGDSRSPRLGIKLLMF